MAADAKIGFLLLLSIIFLYNHQGTYAAPIMKNGTAAILYLDWVDNKISKKEVEIIIIANNEVFLLFFIESVIPTIAKGQIMPKGYNIPFSPTSVFTIGEYSLYEYISLSPIVSYPLKKITVLLLFKFNFLYN